MSKAIKKYKGIGVWNRVLKSIGTPYWKGFVPVSPTRVLGGGYLLQNNVKNISYGFLDL